MNDQFIESVKSVNPADLKTPDKAFSLYEISYQKTLLEGNTAQEPALWRELEKQLDEQTSGYSYHLAPVIEFLTRQQDMGVALPDNRRDFLIGKVLNEISEAAHKAPSREMRFKAGLDAIYVLMPLFPPKDGDPWSAQITQSMFNALHDAHGLPEMTAGTEINLYRKVAAMKDLSADQILVKNTLQKIAQADLEALTKTGRQWDRESADIICTDFLTQSSKDDPLFQAIYNLAQDNRKAMGLPSLDVQALKAKHAADEETARQARSAAKAASSEAPHKNWQMDDAPAHDFPPPSAAPAAPLRTGPSTLTPPTPP